MNKIQKPFHGQPMGCSDGAPSEHHTDAEMSRAYDLIYAAQELGQGSAFIDQVRALLPRKLRMEMGWSKWKYVEA